MTREQAEEYARKLFTERGYEPGPVIVLQPDCHVYFKWGGECHTVAFKNLAYVHFHVGIGTGWGDNLAHDAPEVRIRRMEFEHKPIDELNWYPC